MWKGTWADGLSKIIENHSIFKVDIYFLKTEPKTELASTGQNKRKLMKNCESSPRTVYLISQRRYNQA